ncbi:MAG TPA: NADH:flavin oxidoreductase/NADH oxidase [Noviherbaspirillum sp.]|jgi:2,4-dienoyl-CoA reductase-like NADH-dependent reductase (Old Yellow Enzyme family)|uniref:NADH:flavin oxidoreductase/NADH oxidase n=1 Tax=Noviherbaspirillum sp. TaxID=1926288 RepID=UPI002DDD71C5|nr:NADH:flavin oxidoreductase/NADH oxidase [Noviherbaspirillum sp.]HEV2612089.1 NADH:flavin oxidoreductase/NADH oxidase [Noviherbaspirillum sp.]
MTSKLFTPISLRGLTFPNRVVIAPMCMYSARDGMTNDFHFVHYGRLALGGAGAVIVEATAVQPRGRITHGDLGLWSDEHVPGLARIASFLKAHGAVAGIQLAHAGRKASMQRPWHGNGPLNQEDFDRKEVPWEVFASSPDPVSDGWLVPKEMTLGDIAALKEDFRSAAARALHAGFDFLELHCAHGYLMHSFLSPLINRRTDAYGGDRKGRMKLPLEIAAILRDAWPADRPVFLRVSAVDNVEGGWGIDDTVAFAQALKEIGIDVIDCSSGGVASGAISSIGPREYGYQVGYAQAVRSRAGLPSMAVGLILDPEHAEEIVAEGQADLVAIGREALNNPNWPTHARAHLEEQGRRSFDAWLPQFGWWLQRRAGTLEKIKPWRKG